MSPSDEVLDQAIRQKQDMIARYAQILAFWTETVARERANIPLKEANIISYQALGGAFAERIAKHEKAMLELDQEHLKAVYAVLKLAKEQCEFREKFANGLHRDYLSSL